MLLNDDWIIERLKKFLEANENNTTFQNLWNTEK